MSDLIVQDIYYREQDPLSSTEFTYTRFLVPYLNQYKGLAMFVDSDFVFLDNPAKIVKNIDMSKAVSCIKHPEYAPKTVIKMDGKKQTSYPRKNWSSLMIWNLTHREGHLTIYDVNEKPASYLHRLSWVSDELIGSIDPSWGVLAGYSDMEPKAIHFTDGGPWLSEYLHTPYALEWLNIDKELK